jgi:hypothetical protein
MMAGECDRQFLLEFHKRNSNGSVEKKELSNFSREAAIQLAQHICDEGNYEAYCVYQLIARGSRSSGKDVIVNQESDESNYSN